MASTKSQKRPLSLSISTMHHNPSGHVAIRQSSISFTILFFSIFLLLCANVVSSSDTSFSSDELHDLDEDEFLNEIVEGMGSGAKHKAFEHADKNLNSHGIDGETINGEDGGNGNANGNNFENVINHESNDVNNDNNLKHASSSANRDKKHQHPKPNTPNFIDRFSRAISQEIIRRFPSIQSPLQKFTFPQFQTPWTKNQKRIQSKHSKKDARNLKEEKVGVVHGDGVSRKGASSLIDIQASRRVGAWCRPSPQKINLEEEVDCSSMQQKDLASSDKSIVVCPPDSGKRLEAIPNRKDYEIEDGGSDDLDDLNLGDDVDVQPGTVIFVLPSGDFEQGLGESSCKHAVVPIEDGDETEIETGETTKKVVSTESHCLSQAGQHYGNDHRVIQYALLQREFELGNIDVHRRDFAYQPVVLSLVDEGRNGGNVVNLGDHRGSSGHELDGRIIPDVQAVEVASISSSSSAEPLLQESVGSNDKNSHLTDSAITKRKRRRNQNNDQQVSFRWWSWVSHISQFVHHSTFPGKGNGNGDESVRIESADGDPKGHFHSYQHGQQAPYQSSMYEEAGKNAFAGGSHGEIWRARRRCPISTTDQQARGTQQKQDGNNSTSPCDDGKDLIVKRLKIENGYSILEAGLREVYFGELLAREVESSSLFTTYVDHFFRQGKLGQLELWIVFENAGPSLRSYLYTPVVDSNGGFMVFQHSAFWRRLRKGIAGESKESGKGHDHDHEHDMDMKNEALAVSIPRPLVPKMRQNNLHFDNKTETASVDGDNSGGRDENEERQKTSQEDSAHEGSLLLMEVLKQILTSVAFLHERGIVHRDIKPSNVMCRTSPPLKDGAIPHKVYSVRCLLGDFSSAWDELSDRNLYANGPSSAEQTNEYAPPEVLFQGPAWSPFFSSNPQSYDSWSIGIVALELLLGTPNVFSVDQRTTALLTNRLRKEGANSEDIQRALYLAALSQFCIYLPTKVEGKNWPLRRGDPLHEVKLVKEKCTIRDFHNALRARDPIGTGVDESQDALLHLIWRLLAWDPKDRLSPKQALLHPYFTPKAQHDCRAPSVDMLFKKNCFADLMIPGIHNALESQSLDPKIDMNSSDTAVSEFQCPKCGKTFHDHNSCQKHARSRRHALFCNYDRSTLPQCLNAHSMLPTHPTSGYCDIQGRRRTIEDFHTVHLNPDHQFYGVFDGHMGNLASKYAASSFYGEVEQRLSSVDHNINTDQSNWKEIVEVDLIQSFEDLHGGIVRALASSPGNVMDESGTTATILYVTELAVVIANVGDSRAVLSHWNHDANGHEGVAAMQLTEDHVASSPDEQVQIKDRGGFISKAGGIDRVNGSLAVSRSLGDVKLALFLSRVPHVFALTKKEVYNKCRKQPDEIVNEESVNKAPNISSNHNHPCFIILASDGLWDVMSNQEAVDMVVHVIGTNNESSTGFQEAAELLTHEAYVRGSSDNIGVCVVAIT